MSAKAARRRGVWAKAAQPAATGADRSSNGRVQPADAPADAGLEALRRRLLRLALDVHDGPMQNLTVVGFGLGDLRRRIHELVPAEHQAAVDKGIDQISAELGRVESELRALISALEDDGIESIPLLEAIEQEIAEFEKRCPAEVELVFSGHPRAETDSQRIALQSVTRAALANVAKHSEADRVWVRLSGSPETVTLEIEDNGRGFDAGGANPGRFGLVGMKERVELLGGSFDVQSKPGGPTTITATLQTWRPPSAA